MNKIYLTVSRTLKSAALFFLLTSAATSQAQNVTVNPGNGSYATIADAFTAINNGTHTGALTVSVVNNTAEPAGGAVLNASGTGSSSYSSIVISPSDGAWTISGAATAGLPLIDLNGADNVTINGLNSGGVSLTISNTTVSATANTSTVRFINDATNNTITNCSVLGSFSAAASASTPVNGGNIFFSTGTTTGNDNNTITQCDIGPAGTSLPTRCIYGSGSTGAADVGNSNIAISGNNIFDFFSATLANAGIYCFNGNNGWSITNNRFYQTTTRTTTVNNSTNSLHVPIWVNATDAIAGAQNFTITGNIIGYSSGSSAGIYTLVGPARFRGVFFAGATGETLNNSISDNIITSISVSGNGGNGSSNNPNGTSASNSSNVALGGILITSGPVVVNNNTIGSQTATGSITLSISGTSNVSADIVPVYYTNSSGTDPWTASNNNIGGITATEATASTGTIRIFVFRNSNGGRFTCTGNTIGGSVANSIHSATTANGNNLVGINHFSGGSGTISGNSIRNISALTGTSNTPVNFSVVGIVSGANGTSATTISNNLIYNLSTGGSNIQGLVISAGLSVNFTGNTIYNITNNGTTASAGGIYVSGGTTDTISGNKVYNISAPVVTTVSTPGTPVVTGLTLTNGTTVYSYNNLIGNLTAPMISSTDAIRGINVSSTAATSSYNIYYNTVYLEASSSGADFGTSGIFHAASATNTTAALDLRNNIIVNKSAVSGTGLTVAYRRSAADLTNYSASSNNNIFYAGVPGGTNVLFYDGTNAEQTLSAYQSRVSLMDAASKTEDVPFASTSGPDAMFLHINSSASTAANDGAQPIADLTADFDGGTRNLSTPDIGADEIGSTLPVSLTAFKGVAKGGINQLSWATFSENNNKGFELQRSVDGKNFTSIGFVSSLADNGLSNSYITYEFQDRAPLMGDNYYRLKQVDLDGGFNYSDFVVLKGSLAVTELRFYPNPTQELLTLSFSSIVADNASVFISDLSGRTVTQRQLSFPAGNSEHTFNVSSLPRGIYVVRISSLAGFKKAVKFVKE